MKEKYLFIGITIFQALNLVWAISTEQSLSLIVFMAFVLGLVAFFTFTIWVENKYTKMKKQDL